MSNCLEQNFSEEKFNLPHDLKAQDFLRRMQITYLIYSNEIWLSREIPFFATFFYSKQSLICELSGFQVNLFVWIIHMRSCQAKWGCSSRRISWWCLKTFLKNEIFSKCQTFISGLSFENVTICPESKTW